MDVNDITCNQFKTEFKPELVRDIAKLKFGDAKTRLNEDSSRLLAEVARVLTVEAALRSAQHASRQGSESVELEHVEKAVMQLEVVVVGSYSGLLNVYRPSVGADLGARPSDLLLEKQLGQPALQLLAGSLVSGSSTQQLAILAPHSVSVHTLSLSLSPSDLAHSCSLELVFERALPPSLGPCWQLLVGSFGGGEGRCQSLGVLTASGALAVYEREAREPLVLQMYLPELMLPGPAVYCGSKDSFLIVTPAWEMQAFKFNTLAKASREHGTAKPDWSACLSDPAVALEMVLPSAEGGREPSLAGPELLVLCQRSLTCWGWNGTVKFARRLPATPLCMSHHLADGCLMVLVASNTLLLYRDGQLCWSSQPPFPPIAMATMTLQGIPGHLVLLSDSLELQVCCLGTEPALICAPAQRPEGVQGSTEGKMKELNELNAKLKALNTAAPTGQGDLTVSLTLAKGGLRGVVRLGVVAPLSLVNIAISTTRPVAATPACVCISSLCNSVEVPVTFSVTPGEVPPCSLDVQVAVSYAQADGSPQICQAAPVTLPLSLVMSPSSEQNSAKLEFSLAFNFSGEHVKAIKTVLPGMRLEAGSLHLRGPPGTLSLSLSPGSPGVCLVAGDSAALVALAASCLLSCPELQPSVTSAPGPVGWLLSAVDHHYVVTRSLASAQEELGEVTAWARQVQLRLLARYKDRSAKSLHGLDGLLNDAFADIDAAASLVTQTKKALDGSSSALVCLLRLCCHLLAVSGSAPSAEKLADLRAALSVNNIHKHWIEGTTASLDKISSDTAKTSTSLGSFRDAQPARLKALLARTLAALMPT